MRFLILLLLLFTISASSQNKNIETSQLKKDLVGIWQLGGDGISDAYNDVFRFYSDGKFIFNHSQYKCSKREISYSGRWKIEQGVLSLNIAERTIIVGGHLEADPNCSDSILVNGKQTILQLKLIQKVQLSYSDIFPDSLRLAKFGINRWEVKIDQKLYGKIGDDPTKYK